MYYSYTPKYGELDYLYEKYLKNDPKKVLNFFFDVKNGVYNYDTLTEGNKLEHTVELITAIINVIQYIKSRYQSNYNIGHERLKFYFFCETGKSSYHRGIDMNYKSNRGLNDYLMRDDSNRLFSQIVFFSIKVLEEIINMIPNAHFFLGDFREFDYIPHVVHRYKFTDDDVTVIFSSDKDMYQMQSYMNNVEQLEKLTFKKKVDWHPGRLFINKDNYVDRITYQKNSKYILTDLDKTFAKEHFSLMRAIIGDTGDGVIGVKGIAYITLFKLLPKMIDLILPRDEYNEKIKYMDFKKFDFKRENTIFDLSKIEGFEKEIKKSSKLKLLLESDTIEKLCKNIALMDYEIMVHRRKAKDKDIIMAVLNNTDKFKSDEEISDFINSTGLWTKCPQFKVTITL